MKDSKMCTKGGILDIIYATFLATASNLKIFLSICISIYFLLLKMELLVSLLLQNNAITKSFPTSLTL